MQILEAIRYHNSPHSKSDLDQYKSHLEFGQMKILEASGYHHSPRSKLVSGIM